MYSLESLQELNKNWVLYGTLLFLFIHYIISNYKIAYYEEYYKIKLKNRQYVPLIISLIVGIITIYIDFDNLKSFLLILLGIHFSDVYMTDPPTMKINKHTQYFTILFLILFSIIFNLNYISVLTFTITAHLLMMKSKDIGVGDLREFIIVLSIASILNINKILFILLLFTALIVYYKIMGKGKMAIGHIIDIFSYILLLIFA